MKAKRFFYGYDSEGRSVEKAQSISGKWFTRRQDESQRGTTMSPWHEIEEPDNIGCIEMREMYEHKVRLPS